jgi:hypothetical protein
MGERLSLVERLVGEFAESAELAVAGEVEPGRLVDARTEIDVALRGVELVAARERRAVLAPNVLPFPTRGGTVWGGDEGADVGGAPGAGAAERAGAGGQGRCRAAHGRPGRGRPADAPPRDDQQAGGGAWGRSVQGGRVQGRDRAGGRRQVTGYRVVGSLGEE